MIKAIREMNRNNKIIHKDNKEANNNSKWYIRKKFLNKRKRSSKILRLKTRIKLEKMVRRRQRGREVNADINLNSRNKVRWFTDQRVQPGKLLKILKNRTFPKIFRRKMRISQSRVDTGPSELRLSIEERIRE